MTMQEPPLGLKTRVAELVKGVAAVIVGLSTMIAWYVGAMILVAVVLVAASFVLYLLPEPVAKAVLWIVGILTFIARLGIRDDG